MGVRGALDSLLGPGTGDLMDVACQLVFGVGELALRGRHQLSYRPHVEGGLIRRADMLELVLCARKFDLGEGELVRLLVELDGRASGEWQEIQVRYPRDLGQMGCLVFGRSLEEGVGGGE